MSLSICYNTNICDLFQIIFVAKSQVKMGFGIYKNSYNQFLIFLKTLTSIFLLCPLNFLITFFCRQYNLPWASQKQTTLVASTSKIYIRATNKDMRQSTNVTSSKIRSSLIHSFSQSERAMSSSTLLHFTVSSNLLSKCVTPSTTQASQTC